MNACCVCGKWIPGGPLCPDCEDHVWSDNGSSRTQTFDDLKQRDLIKRLTDSVEDSRYWLRFLDLDDEIAEKVEKLIKEAKEYLGEG